MPARELLLFLYKIAEREDFLDSAQRNFVVGSGLGALASGGLRFAQPGQVAIRSLGALRGAGIGLGALTLSKLYEIMKRRGTE